MDSYFGTIYKFKRIEKEPAYVFKRICGALNVKFGNIVDDNDVINYELLDEAIKKENDILNVERNGFTSVEHLEIILSKFHQIYGNDYSTILKKINN